MWGGTLFLFHNQHYFLYPTSGPAAVAATATFLAHGLEVVRERMGAVAHIQFSFWINLKATIPRGEIWGKHNA